MSGRSSEGFKFWMQKCLRTLRYRRHLLESRPQIGSTPNHCNGLRQPLRAESNKKFGKVTNAVVVSRWVVRGQWQRGPSRKARRAPAKAPARRRRWEQPRPRATGGDAQPRGSLEDGGGALDTWPGASFVQCMFVLMIALVRVPETDTAVAVEAVSGWCFYILHL